MRLFLDVFRADVFLLPGSVRGTQILGLIGSLVPLILIYLLAEQEPTPASIGTHRG